MGHPLRANNDFGVLRFRKVINGIRRLYNRKNHASEFQVGDGQFDKA